MSNLFDYLSWRGDLSFAQDPFHCVDSLVLSRLAYLPFDGLWSEGENGRISLAEAISRLQKKSSPLRALDADLIRAVAVSPRFRGLLLRDYVSILNPAAEKQFSAVTFLGKDQTFVAYRGTDNTLVGWKEDFNMGFCSPVPSQKEAVSYFDRAAAQTKGPLFACGHSKGGNLAVYAALFCAPEAQSRIVGVYNNDGPGFDGNLVSSAAFAALEGRIHTFVPQSSVVGMLLEHEESYSVVHSTQSGFLQHDLYSWEISGRDFIRLASTTNGSRFVDLTLKEWVSHMDNAQRSQFFDALYAIVCSANVSSFAELRADVLKSSWEILRSIKNIDPATRKLIAKTLILLLRSAQKNLSVFFQKKRP